MTTEHTPNGLIGASPKRVEDPPLITGKGCYVDDINLTGMLHLAFQRSPYPHAKIISIDTSNAKAMPGVEAGHHGQRLERKTQSRALAGAAEHEDSAASGARARRGALRRRTGRRRRRAHAGPGGRRRQCN